MIKTVEAWNFKKIDHMLMNLSEGLTALKGANEAGKSTRYQAVAYALFGARALPLSLAETVSWGKPESSLKVRLVFDYAGSEYTIQRSKSGAELFCKSLNLLVSGQAEVTKYVEQLFGVNADTAGKLTVASQNELRGALEGKAAVPLIEKLSNISMIDNLIASAQGSLPCGSTKALESALENCTAVTRPYADFAEIETLVSDAFLRTESAKAELEQAESSLAAMEVEYKFIAETLPAIYMHNTEITTVGQQIARLEKAVSLPVTVFIDNIAELEQKVAQQKSLREAQAAHQVFLGYKPATLRAHYVGTKLTEELEEVGAAHTALVAKRAELKADLRVAASIRINEDQCSLCGKLLQDVPEVVQKNAEVDSRIDAIQDHIRGLEELITTTLARYTDLAAISAETTKVQALAAKLGNFIKVDDSEYPPTVTWGGHPLLTDNTDYAGQLLAAKQQQTNAHLAASQKQADEKALAALKEKLEALGPAKDPKPIQDAEKRVAEQRETRDRLRFALVKAQTALASLEHNLAMAKASHDAEVRAYEAAQTQAAALKESIKEYDSNNALIKRLREVRPIVAAHLWSVVLTTVSRYFSQIRGCQSAVTVADSSFRIDGKPAEAYSGSTLDSLGLAIRMALSKTFLPNLDFLLLDEPAAGMDEEREAAMLGVLAAAGYKQVVVVTHSTIADSFAAQVIQI